MLGPLGRFEGSKGKPPGWWAQDSAASQVDDLVAPDRLLGSPKGVVEFDGGLWVHYSYPGYPQKGVSCFDRNGALRGHFLRDLIVTHFIVHDGALWFLTEQGPMVLDRDGRGIKPFAPEVPSEIPKHPSVGISVAGRVVGASEAGLAIYDDERSRWIATRPSPDQSTTNETSASNSSSCSAIHLSRLVPQPGQ
jgi:hypothetical protein